MNTEAEVLSALSERLSPGELTQVVSSLLHVPEVWAYLHEPGVIERRFATPMPRPLTPWALALDSLGLPDTTDVRSRLPEPYESRLSLPAEDDSGAPSDPTAGLESVALACIRLVRRADTSDGREQIAQTIRSDPSRWISPLACAWSRLDDDHRLLLGLITGENPVPDEMIASVLLANLTPEQAASALTVATKGVDLRWMGLLREIGAASPIERHDPVHSKSAVDIPSSEAPATPILLRAMEERLRGQAEASRRSLEEAWEYGNAYLAKVSDQIAEGARQDADPVVEIEARRRSLRILPTPCRRAWLADAYTRAGRPEEALELLTDPRTTIEEHIAAASANLALRETSSASDLLERASTQAKVTDRLAPYWIRRLSDTARELGQSATAIELARREVQLRPADPDARRNLASIQAAAGDHRDAATHACIVRVLDPSDLTAQKILAQSLQAAGDPKSALPHWQALAAMDGSHLESLAACALDSGETSLAQDAAQRALKASPKSAKAMVHLGRALLAKGDLSGARRHIEKATRLSPDSAMGWIALAESYAAQGDVDLAGETLAMAIQTVPSSGELRMAYGQWLKQAGRLSEALEAFEAAVDTSPGRASWMVEYGVLLRKLGHSEQAVDVLRQAAVTWPGSWEARLALGLTYESTGKLTEAQDVLGEIPTAASEESRFLSARILVEAAKVTGDKSRIGESLAILDSIDPRNEQVEVVAGRALILAGRPAEAVQRFLGCLPKTDDGRTDPEVHLTCVLGLAEAAIANHQAEIAVSQLESARSRFPDSPALMTGLSAAYQAAGLVEQAWQAAEMACALAPDDPSPLHQLTSVALQDERWDRASEMLAKLVVMEPASAESRVDLALACLRAGDVDGARSALASALYRHRREPDVLRRSAAIMLEMGCAASARRILMTAAGISSHDAGLLAELGEVSAVTGNFETSLWAWRARALLDPDDVRTTKEIAAALDGLGRRGEAIQAWEKALKLSPEDASIPAILAKATFQEGDFTAAMKYFDLALERTPDDVDLALQAGRLQLRHGSAEAALQKLEPAARKSSERADVLAALGEAHLATGNPQKALTVLRAASEQADARPSHLALLSLAELSNANLSGASSALDQALAMPAESVDDVIFVSRASLRLARWETAIAVLERWLSEREDPTVFRAWISTRLRLGDARALFAVAAEAPNHAPSAVWEGGAFLDGMRAAFARATGLGVEGDELAIWNTRAVAAAGKATDAELESLEALSLDDPSGEIGEGVAIAYLRSDRAVDALRAMLPDPAKRPVGEWAALIIGLGQQAIGRHEQARQAFSYAASSPVLMPMAEYLAGRAFLQSGMQEKAITRFNKALASWPDEPAWHYRLASEYRQLGDESSALPHLQHAVELAPQNGTYLLDLARAYRGVGQLDESELIYARAVHEFADSGEVWKEAGQLALELGKAEHAVTWFDRACRINPADPHSLVGAARAALALGRTREAREHSLAAQQLAPDDAEVQIAIADVLASQGKVDKALMAYDRAVECASDPIPVHLARSRLLVRAGRSAEAVEALKSLTLSAGDDDGLWAALAEAARSAGDLALAMSAAEQASRVSPRNAGHRLMLARISREAGHLDRALSELSQIDAGTSHDPNVAVEIGHLHEDRRELKRALDAYERAIDLDPANAEAHFRAGLVLKGLKAYEQAGAMLKRAVELNPRSPDVLHQLAAVRALELVHGGIRQTAVP